MLSPLYTLLHTLSHFTLTTTFEVENFPHFTDEETGALKDKLTCPRSQLVNDGAGIHTQVCLTPEFIFFSLYLTASL